MDKSNLAWLSRAFKKINPHNDPRIMLIAPDFDESVIRISAYLSLNIELYKYTAVQDEATMQLGIVCEAVEIEPASEKVTIIRSVDDILGYCDDNRIKAEIKKL